MILRRNESNQCRKNIHIYVLPLPELKRFYTYGKNDSHVYVSLYIYMHILYTRNIAIHTMYIFIYICIWTRNKTIGPVLVNDMQKKNSPSKRADFFIQNVAQHSETNEK